MTWARALLGLLLVAAALVLQSAVIARLPLPGSPPDLVLVVVLAFALAEGPMSGMVTGALAGALADLLADHPLGQLALAYVVVGHAVGTARGSDRRSVLRPFLAVGLGVAAALVIYAAEGLLLGDARVTGAALRRGLTSTVPYSATLVPFVVPLVALLVRRLDRDPERRSAPARRRTP